MHARDPPIGGPIAESPERLVRMGVRGGPGRTRTSNQTVMSAPGRGSGTANFYRFCGTFAFASRASANEMTNDCAALWWLPIASAAVRMCDG